MIKKTIYALASTLAASTAFASSNWTTEDGILVKDSQGQCVRSSDWTFATAHADCIAKPATVPLVLVEPSITNVKPAIDVAESVVSITIEPQPKAVAEIQVIQAETLFDFDKSTLKDQGKQTLDKFVSDLNVLNTAAITSVFIVGHTDSVGTSAYNFNLGARRAAVVKEYLIAKGIDSSSISAVSRGEQDPVADNKTSTGRAKNRRVFLEVFGLK